jgi:hypothetical protein
VSALLLALTLGTASETTLAGTWQGQTPNGMNVKLVLAAKGTALTGTLDREGEVSTISEGTIVKNTFSFKATLGGETETIEGTWENDEIKAWLARQGPERTVVLRRVK